MKRLMARPVLLGLAAAFALGGSLAAQEAQQEPARDDSFQGKVDVNEVLLDVLVTDARGNVIVGLGKDDFVVKEDGKPVDLPASPSTATAASWSPGKPAKKGLKIDRAPQDRYFILFFEDQKDAARRPRGCSPRARGRQPGPGWVRPRDAAQRLGGGRRATTRKLKVQQDFTQRPPGPDRGHPATLSRARPRGQLYPPGSKAGEGPSLTAGLPKGNELRDKTPTIYEALSDRPRPPAT